MNQVQDRTDVRESRFEQNICHYFCETCWPDFEKAEVALCGTDIKDQPLACSAPEEDTCAMCAAVMFNPCSRCGTV